MTYEKNGFEMQIGMPIAPPGVVQKEDIFGAIATTPSNQVTYKSDFIENIKSAGLYKRFLSVVRTLRRKEYEPGIKKKAEVHMITDEELCNELQQQFGNIARAVFDTNALTKSLGVYPELGEAYFSSQVELFEVLKDSAVRLLENNPNKDAIEVSAKVVELQLKQEAQNFKQRDGITVNLNYSNETRKTLDSVLENLEAAPEPAWDSPDEEVEEWEKMQKAGDTE